MTLLEAWKDSVLLCNAQALKLMLLVTFNAMRSVLKTLCVPWFLVTLSIALITAFFLRSTVFSYILYHGVTAMILLAARPSIHKKELHYFATYGLQYSLYIAQLLILLLILVFCAGISFEYIRNLLGYPPPQLCESDPECIASSIFFLVMLLGTQYFGLLTYPLFFYLDRVGNIFKAMLRGIYLILYNLPLMLIYGILIFFVYYLYWAIIAGLFSLAFGISCTLQRIWIMGLQGTIAQYGLLGVPPYLFAICLMYNIYTKRVHDQYSLYQ